MLPNQLDTDLNISYQLKDKIEEQLKQSNKEIAFSACTQVGENIEKFSNHTINNFSNVEENIMLGNERNFQEELAQGMYEMENNIRAKETVVEVTVKEEPEAADDVTYALAADNTSNKGNTQMSNQEVTMSTNIHTGEPCPVGSECYPDVVPVDTLNVTFEQDPNDPTKETITDVEKVANDGSDGFGIKPSKVGIIGAGGSNAGTMAVLAANTGAKEPTKITQEKETRFKDPDAPLNKSQRKKEDALLHNKTVNASADRKQVVAKFTSKGDTVIIELVALTPGQILNDTKTGRYAIFTPNRVITATKICFLPNSWKGMQTLKMNLTDSSINYLIDQLGEVIAFELRNNRVAKEHLKRHYIKQSPEVWIAKGFQYNSSGNVDLG